MKFRDPLDPDNRIFKHLPFWFWYTATLWRIGLYLFLTWPLRRRVQSFRVPIEEFVTPIFFVLRKKPPWWD